MGKCNLPVANRLTPMPIKFAPIPPQESLRSYFDYDPGEGRLRLKHKVHDHPAGSAVGSLNREGYVTVKFKGKLYHATRLIWMWMTGYDPSPLQVDHINGVVGDDRWCNLRLADNASNVHNRHRHIDTQSGIPGAIWLPKVCKWCVSAIHRGERKYFGVFSDPDKVIEILRAYHIEKRGVLFNEAKWLAHIEKSRAWIEWCREMADHEVVKKTKAKQERAAAPKKSYYTPVRPENRKIGRKGSPISQEEYLEVVERVRRSFVV